MGLRIGTQLGPYEILSAIGAGGMGEVYRARDTRLDRIVAIKVLPTHLADKPDLRERFEREARTIASLNHPHICTLHDVGHQDGTDYLVMEYLEGETLAERLKKGPLPLDQVLQYAIEISDALDKAHRKGITHRDLKPGNIMLTKSGTKLLDFGLAKLRQDAAPGSPLSQLPTANEGITAQGTILGTLQYMAPEQLEGGEVDARTDIFAFGAVVYEMVAGKKAFEGKSQASVISAIMSSEPQPISTLQPMTPPQLDRVVKKCLAKEPEKRWQDASDLCDELKWIAEGGSQVTLAPTASAKGIRALSRQSLIFGLCALVLGLAIAGLAVWSLKPSPIPPPKPVSRFTITLPPGQQLAGLDFGHALAISPDGTHLAYIATQGGIQQLYLRAMDSLDAKPLPGTERAFSPFFSPDGKWIGFSADGKLMKVSVDGGVPLTVCDAPSVTGVSWGDDDRIVFARQFGVFGLSQISAAGGKPQALTTKDPAKEEEAHLLPELLPGGKAVLFTEFSGILDDAQIVAQRLDTGERRVLVRGGTDAHYLPTGHLVYAGAGALMAVPFDPSRLQVTGNPISIADGISLRAYGVAQVGISNTGSLVYVSGGIQGTELKLVWVDRKGAEQPLAAPPRAYQSPRLSPDGQRIAVVIHGANDDIWVYDIPRQTFTRLTFAGQNLSPLWTRDGRRIIFRSSPTGSDRLNLFWKSADGSGEAERLTVSDYGQAPSSLSPDGQVLVFDQLDPTTNWDLWMLPLTGDRKPRPFLQTPRNEWFTDLSPDGHWLAYASDESGQQEIYVRPFPTGGGKWQISTEGGIRPLWTRNGELVYRNGDNMMAVSIATHPTLSVGTPRLLFERHYEGLGVYYDVTPDGQRFLMLKASEQTEAAQTQVNVVQNWFEELKQKVPTGKK